MCKSMTHYYYLLFCARMCFYVWHVVPLKTSWRFIDAVCFTVTRWTVLTSRDSTESPESSESLCMWWTRANNGERERNRKREGERERETERERREEVVKKNRPTASRVERGGREEMWDWRTTEKLKKRRDEWGERDGRAKTVEYSCTERVKTERERERER